VDRWFEIGTKVASIVDGRHTRMVGLRNAKLIFDGIAKCIVNHSYYPSTTDVTINILCDFVDGAAASRMTWAQEA